MHLTSTIIIFLLYTVRSRTQVPVAIYRNWSELVSNTTVNLTDLNRFLTDRTALDYNVVVIENQRIPALPDDIFNGLEFDEFRLTNAGLAEFPAGLLRRSRVRRVFFAGNKLERVAGGVFAGAAVDVAGLGANGIAEIEAGAFRGFAADWLVLSDNRLMAIRQDMFAGSTVRGLKLNGNRVMAIERAAFAGVAGLRSIDLADNQLGSVDGAFEDLPDLGELNLSFNRIANVATGAFSGSPVRAIYLTGNQLEVIRRGVFNDPKYTFISLDNNRITDIEEDSFANTTRLQYLILSENKLGALNATALGGVRRAICLKLNGNDVTEVRAGAFARVELAELDLSANFLRSIERGDFAGARVKSLKLSGNEIEAIEAGALGEVRGLAYVDLDDNRLGEVKADAICLPLANVSMVNNRIRRIDKSLLVGNTGVYDYRLENNPIWYNGIDDDDEDDNDDDSDDDDDGED